MVVVGVLHKKEKHVQKRFLKWLLKNAEKDCLLEERTAEGGNTVGRSDSSKGNGELLLGNIRW